MFALIEDATGRVLDWRPTPMTAGVGETVVAVPSHLNLIELARYRWVFALPKTIASLTQVGGLATATTSTAHNWVTGQLVDITGVDQLQYIGLRSITVTGPTTFTFAVDAAAVTPATGAAMTATPQARFRESTQAEIDAYIVIQKDALVDAIFALVGDGPLTPAIFKKTIAAVLQETHQRMVALANAAGLSVATRDAAIGTFTQYANGVKTNLRGRL